MPLKHTIAGPNNVDAYRMSGVPYLSASVLKSNDILQFDFPFTTKFIKIRNDETDTATRLAMGITLNGTLGSNFFKIPGNSTETFEIRTKRLFLSNSAGNTSGELGFQICAGLTVIPEFPILTGSNNYKGVG